MNRQALAAAILVACLGATAWLWFGRGDGGRSQRRDLADELAAWVVRTAAAERAGSLLILAPVADAGDPFPRHLGDRLLAHAQQAGFAPVAMERVPYSPTLEATGEPVERADFLRLLGAHAEAGTVISLVGVPRLRADDLPAAKRPRLIVASTVLMPHLEELPPGLLSWAVAVKQDPRDPRRDPELGELGIYFTLLRPAR